MRARPSRSGSQIRFGEWTSRRSQVFGPLCRGARARAPEREEAVAVALGQRRRTDLRQIPVDQQLEPRSPWPAGRRAGWRGRCVGRDRQRSRAARAPCSAASRSMVEAVALGDRAVWHRQRPRVPKSSRRSRPCDEVLGEDRGRREAAARPGRAPGRRRAARPGEIWAICAIGLAEADGGPCRCAPARSSGSPSRSPRTRRSIGARRGIALDVDAAGVVPADCAQEVAGWRAMRSSLAQEPPWPVSVACRVLAASGRDRGRRRAGRREGAAGAIGPFDQDQRALRRLVPAELGQLRRVADAIEIGMHDREGRRVVELHQREGRARHFELGSPAISRIRARAKAVLPAPRSPESVTRSPGAAVPGRSRAASATVAASSCRSSVQTWSEPRS